LWVRRSSQFFSENVQDIKFAPKHHGLMLAVAVANGNIQMYEAKDLSNLTSWVEVFKIKTSDLGCNCLSWNPAFDEPPMIVVGCSDFS
jgi:nucleoporin SEH1